MHPVCLCRRTPYLVDDSMNNSTDVVFLEHPISMSWLFSSSVEVVSSWDGDWTTTDSLLRMVNVQMTALRMVRTAMATTAMMMENSPPPEEAGSRPYVQDRCTMHSVGPHLGCSFPNAVDIHRHTADIRFFHELSRSNGRICREHNLRPVLKSGQR